MGIRKNKSEIFLVMLAMTKGGTVNCTMIKDILDVDVLFPTFLKATMAATIIKALKRSGYASVLVTEIV